MEISLQAFITIMVMVPLVGIGYVSILHALSRRFQSAKHREDILFVKSVIRSTRWMREIRKRPVLFVFRRYSDGGLRDWIAVDAGHCKKTIR